MSKRALLCLLLLFVPALCVAEEIDDPYEPVNRAIFKFNDKFDRWIMEPVSEGYDYVVPDGAQRSVSNFFDNLEYPVLLVSDVVQLKFGQALNHTGRFLINTTLGLAGLFDVADCMGLKEHEEDFGIALAYHGVPSGPYIVLPFLGPSNLRDAVGLGVDFFLNPTTWVGEYGLSSSEEYALQYGTRALELTQLRVNLDEAIETSRESSLDRYLFVQSAYYQYRKGVLNDGESDEDPFDDEDWDE